jgi:KDO2-lipid IV(A) lauroyltransferase
MRRSRRKPKFHKVAANYLGYFALQILSRIIMALPFRAASFLGESLGVLAYHLGTEERNRALRNLRRAFGDAMPRGERRRIALNVFRNFGRALTEALAGTKLSTPEVEALVVNPREFERRMRAVLDEGNGMIVLTGHLGNWELGGMLAARHIPLNVVANRFNFEPFNRLAEGLRTAGRMKIIYLNENPRVIIRALKRNEVVAMLPDQDIRRLPGTYALFFGRPAWTPIGIVLTAKVSRAPIVPVFMVRRGLKYVMIVGEKIPLRFSGDRKRDAGENTQRWTDVFETYVRRYPDQWAWNHLRWKTRPSDIPHAFRRHATMPSELRAR